MKRLIPFTALLLGLALIPSSAPAQERATLSFSGGSDLVSGYVWRGVPVAGISLQPTLAMSVGDFSASAWGSVDFASTPYKEMDLSLAYALGPVTFSLTDYYWTGHPDDRYFVFDANSPHRVEVGVSWVVSEKFPLNLSWYTMLFGAADTNDRGKRAYASYFEVAYPFAVKGIDMKAGVGMVPWNAEATYLSAGRDFYVQNVFLNAGKSWELKGAEGLSFGLFTNLIWNPALENVNFVGGISLRM